MLDSDAGQSIGRLAKQIAAWQEGVPSEVRFWNLWFESQGLEWPDDYRQRLKPDREAPPWIFEGANLPPIPRVLDVGAGPLTLLGTRYNGNLIDLVASDPLAPFYDQIADNYGVQRPVRTVQAFAEDLSCYYDAESFDIVFCSNALDHSFDPVRGIEEMFKVAKPKGRIVLVHSENEAVFENYEGLHQWNFNEEGGKFIIWNRENRIDVTDRFSARANVRTNKVGRGLTVFFDKTGVPTLDHSSAAPQRVRELLAALLLAARSGP